MLDQSLVKLTPFVLSGGYGTRLWPLSRQAFPKQFLPLIDQESLLQKSIKRLNDPMFETPSVLCNNEHRFLVAEQLHTSSARKIEIILEPVSRNTAPPALIAALVARKKNGKNALVLLMPSDHVIDNNARFLDSVKKGIASAVKGHIVTFGVRPDAPETRYGYIETRGAEGGVANVHRFVEKPSRETAQAYLASGDFLWNSGVFLYSADAMIENFLTHAPNIYNHCKKAFEGAQTDLDFLRLDKGAYEKCANISLDYAIMEKINDIKCVALDVDWSDLGSWHSLWEIGEKDDDGNVMHGDVLLLDTKESYIHSHDGICVALIGLDEVFVIATKDAILMAPKTRSQEVGRIVEQLENSGRHEHIYHMRVHRPWGWYERISEGNRFQVKCLSVKPGARLSMQSHYHRAEHWVVVSGTAEVTVGEDTFMLTENQSTYIPIGTKHRLGNPGKVPALLVEVQSGAYLDEDDIVRYEDEFNRKKDD